MIEAVTFGGEIAGVPFVFQGFLMQLFAFLWLMYGLLVPFDVGTRARIEKYALNKNIKGRRVHSHPMRKGLQEKSFVLAIMIVVAFGGYFISGIFNDGSVTCKFICISISTMLNLFMGMYVVTEIVSIIENQIEYSEISGQKVNPVTRLLAKTFGILYKGLAKKLESNVNSLNNNNEVK